MSQCTDSFHTLGGCGRYQMSGRSGNHIQGTHHSPHGLCAMRVEIDSAENRFYSRSHSLAANIDL